MPTGIGAYDEAAPLNGNVPPMTNFVFVTPGGACAPASAVTHVIAATANAAASRPNLILMPLSFGNRGELRSAKSISPSRQPFVSVPEQSGGAGGGNEQHEKQDQAVDGRRRTGALRVERRAERRLDPAEDLRRVEPHVFDEQRAEDDADQEQERELDLERVRVHKTDDDRVERPCDAGEERRDSEGECLRQREVDTGRDGGDLRLANRSEGATELPGQEQPAEHEHSARDRPGRHVGLVAGEDARERLAAAA